MVIMGYAVTVGIAIFKPPFCPFSYAGIYFLNISLIRKIPSLFKPIKDPTLYGGFTKAPQDTRIVYKIGVHTGVILMIVKYHKLIPCKLRASFSQCHCIKAIIPAPNAGHPILRHIYCRTLNMSRWLYNTGPIDIPCQLTTF